jgi:hypothetical protein
MDIVFAFTILTVFAIAAARFGRDSRERFSSAERELAGRGVTWGDLETHPGDQVPAAKRPYPTLALIEQALDERPGHLTNAPNAAALEVRARQLAAEYWSDTAWMTGIVPRASFDRVVAELAPFLMTSPVEVAAISPLAGQVPAAVVLAA